MKDHVITCTLVIKKQVMKSMLLIIIFPVFIFLSQAANISFAGRKRALEINLLSNLKARHKEAKMKCSLPHDITSSSSSCSNKSESTVNTKLSIDDLNIDIQQYILRFLNTSELLDTRLLNWHYYKLSGNANYLNIYSINPYFALKESWMNFKLGYFLFEYFENSRFNYDDLLATIHKILLKKFPKRTSYTMTILSFLHEYENGVDSSFPLNRCELYYEIMKSDFEGQSVPKSMNILNEYFDFYAFKIGLSSEQFRRIFETAKELKRSKADILTIMQRLNFDQLNHINNSDFGYLPSFVQVFFFDLILPLCNGIERIQEALDIFYSAEINSPFFLEYLEEKFPYVLSFLNEHNFSLYSKTLRALTIKFPRQDVIGLDYLLTRDIANPFDIETLKAMDINIHVLISAFISNISMSLTDVDIVSQMKEAGLFSSISRPEVRDLIEQVISSSYNFEY